ncbi:MAG: 4-hydroxy-tetrahydrodipicolinate reductase [Proteobacteria bacterium]|nr:4-hydroxy-tetrahydrodipicolinate reductase [Pseudomonadota bacterium]
MDKGIGIAGITGRMGSLLTEEVAAAGLLLAGGINRGGASRSGDTHLFVNIAALADASDVVIDFTHASVVDAHAKALSTAGTAWVLGTTGLTAAEESVVSDAAKCIAVVYAPNFTPGVNLVLALAEQMSAALPAEKYDAEIVELHHRQKVDAPSGTAIGIGQAVARGRGVDLEDVMECGRKGQFGARAPGAIGFAALRGGQVVGEHTLLFASATEHIAITHRAFDRRAFAAGAVHAAVWIETRPPGLYSMMDVLGIR